MAKELTLAGIGEILWDMLPSGKQLGGAPANFAFHARQLGAHSHVVSAVGNDHLGVEIINQLEAVKLSSHFIKLDTSHKTGTVDIELDAKGVPQYIIHENVAWDFLTFSEKHVQLARSLDAVCFGSLAQRKDQSRNSLHTFIKSTRESCLRIFDINLRQHYFDKKVVTTSLELANCLKLNEDEFPILAEMYNFNGSEADTVHDIMHKFNLDLLALTKGGEGSWLFTQGDQSYIASPQVHIADTVGAGDSFTAAMTVGWLRGLPLRELHQNAVNLSAHVCTKHGAMPSYDNAVRLRLS